MMQCRLSGLAYFFLELLIISYHNVNIRPNDLYSIDIGTKPNLSITILLCVQYGNIFIPSS